MKKLMKFENSDIQMIQINGIWYFELYSVGMALGQLRIAKGKNYPRKDRIDENVKNAEIKPVVRNGQPFITEEQLYDLMLETRTDKCRVFRKWLTNEVLPALNHEGTYTMKHEPKTDKPYEYFDKTYNGVLVLTTEDIEHITSIHQTTVAWWFRQKAEEGKDYYYLEKVELQKFKMENPKLSRLSKRLYAITREGFIKICRAYGVQIETPKCFEVKEEPQKPQIDYNKFERAFSLGASSGKLVKNIKNDIITIQMICDFMGCGFHVYSDYDAYRKTLYEAVKKLYTYANDLRQIKLEC